MSEFSIPGFRLQGRPAQVQQEEEGLSTTGLKTTL